MFVINSDETRLSSFQLIQDTRASYLSLAPDAEVFDFTMSVPFGGLEGIFYWAEYSIGPPALKGCTPDIDPTKIPQWDALVAKVFRYPVS